MKRLVASGALAVAIITAAPGSAQETTDPAAFPVQQEEDDEFPLGLLGLLGLAGLLGLKRRDDRDRVVHTDTRRP